MTKNKKWVLGLSVVVIALIFFPLLIQKNAQFTGSDDAGSKMVETISGEAYEPWLEPVAKTVLGGELPGEVETLLFCIQTGIGVGILAFIFGYLVARKKYKP